MSRIFKIHLNCFLKKYSIALLFSFYITSVISQEKYPQIFEYEKITDSTTIENQPQIQKVLMVNKSYGIELDTYGTIDTEYQVLSGNNNSVLLSFEQASKYENKGRCASGTEKGILYFKVNSNGQLTSTKRYYLESCWLSIETVNVVKTNCCATYYISDFVNDTSKKIMVDFKNVSVED